MTVSIDTIRIPIDPKSQYEFSDASNDDRFKRVKIWIAHSGENLNHSYFKRETLESLATTLPNVPIVGYVEANKDDEDDFSDHRQKITLKNNDIEVEYMCHAYGFIPEDNNAQIEYRGGKEWLTAEGYLWTKFEKSIDIFDEANGTKSHSMEIDNVEGFADDNGLLNVTSARFSALCILGEHVNPGMNGSTIEYFSANSIQEEIKKMIFEFTQKGEQDLDKPEVNTVEETVVEPEVAEEPIVEDDKEFNEEENASEDKPEEDNEPEAIKEPETTDETVEEPKEDEEDKPKDEEKYQLVFNLSHEDIRSKIYDALNAEDAWGWIIETFDDEFIYQVEEYKDDSWSQHIFKRKYTMTEDNVSLGEATEVFAEFLTQQELEQVKNNRTKISELETELSELKMAKENAEKTQKEDLINSYSEKLDEDEKNELLESAIKFSVSDLEKEIAYKLFKKNEETPNSSQAYAANFDKGEKDGRYGDLDRLFHS